jgi:hypothetical protein
MEGTIKEKVLNRCTTAKFWVCMVEGRVLVSRRGNCAFTRKSSAAQAFLNSEYWYFVEDKERVKLNIDFDEWETNYKNESKRVYKELLESGIVKYIEVFPVPSWV